MATMIDNDTRAVRDIESMIRLVTLAKAERDPCAWLHDRLLDLRRAITEQ